MIGEYLFVYNNTYNIYNIIIVLCFLLSLYGISNFFS